MKHLLFIFSIGLVLLFGCNGNTPRTAPAGKLLSAIEQLDVLCDSLDVNHQWMGNFLITRNDSIIYMRQLGFRNLPPSHDPSITFPNNRNTKFRIGSVTKTITAIMILQLVEEGKLSLNTYLSDFFPEIPLAERITVLHLLNHSSGIHDFINDKNTRPIVEKPLSRSELLQLIGAGGNNFEPGMQHRYSNPNYHLLGLIIEKVTGNSYANEFAQRIHTPLRLQNTTYGKSIDSTQNEAFSFVNHINQWEKAAITDMTIPGAAGGLSSTTEDLATSITNLFGGKLLSKPMLNRMVQTEKGYGLGLFRKPLPDGSYFYTHSGHIDQFYANYIYLPDMQLTVVSMTNGYRVSPDILDQAFIAYLFEQHFERPQFHSAPISHSKANQLTGGYKNASRGLAFDIRYENEQLLVELIGQPTFAPRVLNDSTLRIEVYEATLRFSELHNAAYQKLTLEQGDTILFQRMK